MCCVTSNRWIDFDGDSDPEILKGILTLREKYNSTILWDQLAWQRFAVSECYWLRNINRPIWFCCVRWFLPKCFACVESQQTDDQWRIQDFRMPRNGAFCEHTDTITQFTRPVAIRLKPAKSSDVRAKAKCMLYSTKKTTFSRFVSFIKVILW